MTTQTQTSETQAKPMVYAAEKTAKTLASKMTKRQGQPFQVVKIPTGFQVCPVTVLQPATSPHDAKPVSTAAPKVNPTAPAKEKAAKATVVVELTFGTESKAYLNCFLDGKPVYVGKSNAIAWELSAPVEGKVQTIRIQMEAAYAKKRAFPIVQPIEA